MKDKVLLLFASIVASVMAWGFWRYTEEYGFLIIQTIVLLSLFADNYRLRRMLRKHNINVRADFQR